MNKHQRENLIAVRRKHNREAVQRLRNLKGSPDRRTAQELYSALVKLRASLSVYGFRKQTTAFMQEYQDQETSRTLTIVDAALESGRKAGLRAATRVKVIAEGEE